MLIIDKYAYTNKLAKLNPMIKLIVVAISLIIATTINNNYINVIIFITMMVLTTFVAGIPFKNYIKILILPMSFLLISTISILISISSKDVYIYSLKIGSKYMGITNESILQSINITIRVFASVSATFFLGLTTSLNQLIIVFNKMKLPSIIIELLVLIYRFIFVFLEEANEIYIAQEIRFGYCNFKNTFNSTSLLIKALFIRMFLRYEDMVNALDAKLYDGEFKIGD